MFLSADRRLFYALVPSVVIVIGGIVFYRFRRKNANRRLPASEHLILEVQVPDHCIGSIIGKGGEAIKRFQQQFSVRCMFAKNDDVPSNRKYQILTIRGQRNKVFEAEVEIRRLIAQLPEYREIEMFIPERACGFIIGKNGSRIKEIRESTKARLSMDRKIIDSLESTSFTRLIISGTCEQIAAAKTLVEERLLELEQKQSVSTMNSSVLRENFTPTED